MKTNNTTIIILLAAAGLGYYLWTKRRKTAAEVGAAAGSAAVTAAANTAGQILTGGGTTGTTGTTGSGTSAGKYTFTDAELQKNLSKGSTGKNVKALQLFLIKAGQNLPGGADGVFGTNTENALFNFNDMRNATLKNVSYTRTWITAIDESQNKIYGKLNGTGSEVEFETSSTPVYR
jgi:hypothetical protein